ncbi:MAG: FG-GAP repeat protein [Planctomycetota bacterium]|jgi:hypothetical protein
MAALSKLQTGRPNGHSGSRPLDLPRILLLLFAAALAVALLTSQATAQTCEEKLWQQDGQFEDAFGQTVFLDDGTVVVAEPGIDGTGRVSVHARVGPVWTHLADIVAPDASPGARFGDALWLDGDTLVVGAPFDGERGPEAGAVYVYERSPGAPGDPLDDTWTFTAKLYPTGAGVPAPVPTHFGFAVSLEDDTLMAGAPGWVWPLPKDVPGGVAVYVRDDGGTPGDVLDDVWVEQAWLAPASPLPNDFGIALRMLPGARAALVGEAVHGSPAQGSVRIIHRDDQGTPDPLDDTWADVDQLTGRDVGPTYGASLAFAGSILLVGGGYTVPEPGFETEFVEVYVLDDAGTGSDPSDDAWIPDGTLGDPPGSAYGGFGSVLALSDGPGPPRALVNQGGWIWGPPFHGGRVRIFERQGGEWIEQLLTQAPDAAVKDGFGGSMVLDGELAVIGAKGAPYVDDDPAVEGSAYVLDLATPSPWSVQPVSGAFMPFGGWGRLETGASVTVRLYGTWTPQRDVVLVIGPSAILAPFKGSTMVPLPTLLFPLVTGDNGDVAVSAAWPRADAVPSGTEVWFQVWIPPIHSFESWETTQGLLATQP